MWMKAGWRTGHWGASNKAALGREGVSLLECLHGFTWLLFKDWALVGCSRSSVSASCPTSGMCGHLLWGVALMGWCQICSKEISAWWWPMWHFSDTGVRILLPVLRPQEVAWSQQCFLSQSPGNSAVRKCCERAHSAVTQFRTCFLPWPPCLANVQNEWPSEHAASICSSVLSMWPLTCLIFWCFLSPCLKGGWLAIPSCGGDCVGGSFCVQYCWGNVTSLVLSVAVTSRTGLGSQCPFWGGWFSSWNSALHCASTLVLGFWHQIRPEGLCWDTWKGQRARTKWSLVKMRWFDYHQELRGVLWRSARILKVVSNSSENFSLHCCLPEPFPLCSMDPARRVGGHPCNSVLVVHMQRVLASSWR